MQDPPSFDTLYLHDRVARLREGDVAAADELLRACSDRLERLARKMLRGFPAVRGEADTADVLSCACVRLLAALRAVMPGSTREFFALSALQMRRELLDLTRARSGRAGGLDRAGDVLAPSDGDLEPWTAFHEAVETLPAEQREVVGLVFYHGWKQAQVAELFGVEERTVRRRWAAAVARLQAALGGLFPPEGD